MGGEGADGIEDGEAVAAGGVAAASSPSFPGGVAAGDLDPLDELLEAPVVDEGGLPLGDDAGLVLPRELHHRGILARDRQGQGPVCRSGGGSNPAWRAAYIGGDGYGGGRRVVCRSLRERWRERASAPVRGATYVPARLG